MMMMPRRRRAIGEVVSAAILLAGMAAASIAMLAAVGEQSQVTTDDIRSRMDIMRAQAVEQLDVTGTSWNGPAGGGIGNYTFLVSNFGDFNTTIPFALYDVDGAEVTNRDVIYTTMGNTNIAHCTTAVNCDLYKEPLPYKGLIRIIMVDWPGTAAGGDPLIIVTDTGRAMRVGDR